MKHTKHISVSKHPAGAFTGITTKEGCKEIPDAHQTFQCKLVVKSGGEFFAT